jgi:mannose-6-phosphate isomerase-like protein (cupin superfamily)
MRGTFGSIGINCTADAVAVRFDGFELPIGRSAVASGSDGGSCSFRESPVFDVTEKPIEVVDLASLPPVACPCGVARRAFADRDEFPGTVHLTTISEDAAYHYHKEHTEVYVVLDCGSGAAIELDGTRYPVKPHCSVLIPPGVRHRACGEMTVLILCTPNFDPADEHFD